MWTTFATCDLNPSSSLNSSYSEMSSNTHYSLLTNTSQPGRLTGQENQPVPPPTGAPSLQSPSVSGPPRDKENNPPSLPKTILFEGGMRSSFTLAELSCALKRPHFQSPFIYESSDGQTYTASALEITSPGIPSALQEAIPRYRHTAGNSPSATVLLAAYHIDAVHPPEIVPIDAPFVSSFSTRNPLYAMIHPVLIYRTRPPGHRALPPPQGTHHEQIISLSTTTTFANLTNGARRQRGGGSTTASPKRSPEDILIQTLVGLKRKGMYENEVKTAVVGSCAMAIVGHGGSSGDSSNNRRVVTKSRLVEKIMTRGKR